MGHLCRAELYGPIVFTAVTTNQNVGMKPGDSDAAPFFALPIFKPPADRNLIRLILKVTAAGTGTITPKFYSLMSDATTKVQLNATLTQTANGTYVYEIAQNGGAASGDVTQSTQRALPTNLLIAIEKSDASAWTYECSVEIQ